MMFNAMPRLPRALLHILTASKREYVRDPAHGGQSKPVDTISKTFWGIVLPLTNAEWRQLPEGSYTHKSQKLYTDDDIDIQPGQVIRDTFDGKLYTVTSELAHSTIHPMIRYIVEGVTKK